MLKHCCNLCVFRAVCVLILSFQFFFQQNLFFPKLGLFLLLNAWLSGRCFEGTKIVSGDYLNQSKSKKQYFVILIYFFTMNLVLLWLFKKTNAFLMYKQSVLFEICKNIYKNINCNLNDKISSSTVFDWALASKIYTEHQILHQRF